MFRFALIAAAIAAFAACPPKRIDFGPRGEIDDPEALLKLVDEAGERVLTLTGESKVRVDTPEAKGAFSMFVAISRPGLVHLEPLDFFGKPQAVLAVNGERFGLYQAQDNRYYTGPATPQNVSRFLPIVVPAPELVQIMLGDVPRLLHDRLEMKTDEGCACYVLTLHRGQVRQTLKVHPTTFRVLASDVEGVPAYDLQYDDFQDFGRIVFPRRVRLSAPHAQVELDLQYNDLALNQPPDLTLFDPTPPEGIEVVEVDEQGRPTTEGVPPPTAPELVPEAAPDAGS